MGSHKMYFKQGMGTKIDFHKMHATVRSATKMTTNNVRSTNMFIQ